MMEVGVGWVPWGGEGDTTHLGDAVALRGGFAFSSLAHPHTAPAAPHSHPGFRCLVGRSSGCVPTVKAEAEQSSRALRGPGLPLRTVPPSRGLPAGLLMAAHTLQ